MPFCSGKIKSTWRAGFEQAQHDCVLTRPFFFSTSSSVGAEGQADFRESPRECSSPSRCAMPAVRSNITTAIQAFGPFQFAFGGFSTGLAIETALAAETFSLPTLYP